MHLWKKKKKYEKWASCSSVVYNRLKSIRLLKKIDLSFF